MSTQLKKSTKNKPIVMLHGFGVRGYFWDPIKKSKLTDIYPHIFAPDLDFTNIEIAIESAKDKINEVHKKNKGPVCLIGHSLGGILAAIAGKDLGPEVVSKIIIISTPYGDQNLSKGVIKFQRWILKNNWLLPGFITRPSFFTSKTPIKVQKELWQKSKKTKETGRMIDQFISSRLFHTDLFTEPLKQDVLAIAGKDDKVVKIDLVKQFAEILGAKMKIYDGVRHDDLIYAPDVLTEVIDDIVKFL